jgi:hypothetical protein
MQTLAGSKHRILINGSDRRDDNYDVLCKCDTLLAICKQVLESWLLVRGTAKAF